MGTVLDLKVKSHTLEAGGIRRNPMGKSIGIDAEVDGKPQAVRLYFYFWGEQWLIEHPFTGWRASSDGALVGMFPRTDFEGFALLLSQAGARSLRVSMADDDYSMESLTLYTGKQPLAESVVAADRKEHASKGGVGR